MKTTISKLSNDFRTAMVDSAYKFESTTTKSADEPLMTDCQLRDFYCSFCGCTEKPIEEPFSWPECSSCGGV
jgi:hypothetical protein